MNNSYQIPSTLKIGFKKFPNIIKDTVACRLAGVKYHLRCPSSTLNLFVDLYGQALGVTRFIPTIAPSGGTGNQYPNGSWDGITGDVSKLK
jgi:hypothetical protein